MHWLEDYRNKRMSAADAVKLVNSGDRVYIGSGCAVPHALVQSLAERAAELSGVEIVHHLTIGPVPYIGEGMQGHFRCNDCFVGANTRDAVNAGEADYVPLHLHEMPRLFREKRVPLDAACVIVSPPDEHGFCSFGIEVGVTKPAAVSARIILAEVNRLMPRTLGDSFIHVSKLTACVEVDRPLDIFAPEEVSGVEKQIAKHIAGLIEDGACLQLGIGGIPDAVLGYLADKQDLGVHTELFTAGLPDLMSRGVVTCERKNFHPGKVVAGFILGNQDLYDFVHDNAQVEFYPTDYVNNPFNIARNDSMVAINAAIQVDLTGQVCADSIGEQIYSGFGGQVDFMRGAAMSMGGLPITALPATARQGTVSRIVPTLSPGSGVVLTRADVHCIVTENGVAWMHGRNVRQRARALIEIADPRYQEDLMREAHARRIFGPVFPGHSRE